MAGRAVRRHIRRAALLQTVLVEREKGCRSWRRRGRERKTSEKGGQSIKDDVPKRGRWR